MEIQNYKIYKDNNFIRYSGMERYRISQRFNKLPKGEDMLSRLGLSVKYKEIGVTFVTCQ